MNRFYAFIILFAFSTTTAFGQVVVNEFSAANLEDYADNYGGYEDWIELYNTSGSSADISGWFLSDNENNTDKYQFPAGTTINGGGFLRIWCDGRDEVSSGQHHAAFKLKQTKMTEEVVLSNSDTVIVDNIPLGITMEGQSWARETNGGNTWKICTNPTPNGSNNGTNQYDGFAEKPTVDVVAGFYSSNQTVTMTNNPANATVRYTTNGDNVTNSSPVFPGSVSISSTTVLKLRSYSNDPDILPSFMEFNTYFINDNFSLPVFSVAADEVVDLANGQGSLIPIGSIEYFENEERTAISYGELNRHGQDSWVNFQRSLDYICRDEMGYTDAINDTLFHHHDRDKYQRFMFRASGDDNYPANNVPANSNNVHDGGCHVRDEYVHTLSQKAGMELDVRSVERVILYLNGEYWGVYAIRERPDDHDYTDFTYGQGKYNLQYLETWGATQAEYGGQGAFDDWFVFRDFVLNNDMSIPANYAQVEATFNRKSLIDYMTTNLMVVASDWLNYNTGWWRGTDPNGSHKKWAYVLWDLDATFDYYINYSGVPNTDPDALPCDIEEIAEFMDGWFNNPIGMHEVIFLKLLDESPTFQQLYYSRYADHMNTAFSCENMTTVFDSMVATIQPEMPRHIQRWGGTMNEWEGNIEEMRDFIEARCLNVADALVDCYQPEVSGPYNITLQVMPAGAGRVKFNTLWHEGFPWNGDYYGTMENLIEADANADFVFSHWLSSSGNVISPNIDSVEGNIVLASDDTLTAVFLSTVGVEELTNENTRFDAYPVPANDQLEVNLVLPADGTYTLNLHSADGRLIYTELSSSRNFRTSISTTNLANGVYNLSIDSDSGRLYRRVAVTH